MEQKILQISNSVIGNVFGKLDENVKKIEEAYGVVIINRDEQIQITGSKESAAKAETVLKKLEVFAQKGELIAEQQVNYLIASQGEAEFEHIEKITDDTICLTASNRPIKPKTVGQKKYLDLIRQNTIVFAIGPAGTGKTYLAMAMAITALRTQQVSRIILTRPAIEAGESLGFLPGDLQQKVDPYLRPLYDALHDIMGADMFQKQVEKGTIEVAPLAYMRGRTLDNSFIVLDEAQNTTPEQMKMFLTRIGFNSKAVITGDVTQIDLPTGKKSGLNDATQILDEIAGIGISHLTAKDVVRHPLVQKIIHAYEKRDARNAYKLDRENKRNATLSKRTPAKPGRVTRR
ncbi:MAG: PhoH family protein [Defluviitaleaceae bacterium]|nr:PhoH family protein [Defluviitaleaceae bacterium]